MTQGPGAGNLLEEVRDVARLAGYEMQPWQEAVMAVWSAYDERGQWVHRRSGASVPRQSGKSVDGILWALALSALMGYKVLWTDHNYSTTCEMLKRFRKVIGRKPADTQGIKAFNRLVTAASSKTAQEAFEFAGGGVLAFCTRTNTGGLGYSFDVVIYDEAQELKPEHVQALAPTMSSGAKHNSQAVYLGTPTRAGSLATSFLALRNEALGDSCGDDVSWVEWGVDEVGDVRDEARLYEANPSLAAGVADIDSIRSGMRQMGDDHVAVAQEYLGYWLPGASAATCLLPGSWEKCEAEENPVPGGKLAFGVKFSPDGARAAVSWAQVERRGPSYVELYDIYDARRGAAGIADTLIRNKSNIACVVIDGKSGAAALAQRLIDLGMKPRAVVQCGPSGVQAAAAMLVDEVGAGTLSHIASPALDESAEKSIRREIGADGFGFGDGPDSSSVAVESASLALWGARTTKRDPRRKQRVSW